MLASLLRIRCTENDSTKQQWSLSKRRTSVISGAKLPVEGVRAGGKGSRIVDIQHEEKYFPVQLTLTGKA
jgi:hypothetical protein